MKKITQTLSAVFCLAVLFAPLGWLFTPANHEEKFVRETEKRMMEEWPRIGTWRDVLRVSVCQQVALALRDRLPGRGSAILMKNRLAYRLGEWRFGEVDRGRDGWLFIRGAYYRPWEQPEQVRKTLKRMEYWLRSKTAGEPAWTFFIGPDKDEIYPEKMAPLLGRLLTQAGRRREMIANYCADFSGPEINGLWDPYHAAKQSASEPIFFKLDTHHTNVGMLIVVRAIVERCQAGIWDPAEVVTGEKAERISDLGPLSGLGVLREPERKHRLRRPGVELVSEESAPDKDWQQPARYRARSATRPMIAGRTLLLHDSLLAEARPWLSQFFEDLTCMHYDDFIRDHALDADWRRQYDRILMEVAARQATFVWGKLLRLLNAKPLREIALDSLRVQSGGKNVPNGLTADGWRLSGRGRDLKLFLPKLDFPAGNDYLLRIDLDSDGRGPCRLFLRQSSGQAFSSADEIREEVRVGRNQLSFPVSAANLAAGLRFDPASDAARLLIRSVWICRIDPSWSGGQAEGAGGPEPLSQVRLWIQPSAATEPASLDKSSLPVVGNQQVRMLTTCRGLELRVDGRDPMLFLPGRDCGQTGEAVLSLEIEAPQKTLCQIYFRRSLTEKYSEQQSRIRRLHAGMNRLEFTLPAAAVNYGLRLDPACQNGVYLIRRLYVLKKSKWGLRTLEASRADFIYPYSPLANWSQENLAQLETGKGMKSRLTPQGLELEAETGSASVRIPGVELESDRPVVVSLLLDSARQTACRLVYRTDAEQSVQVEVQPGLNQMNMVLPAEAVRQGLRFDPAGQAGTYRLRSVELGTMDEGSRQEPAQPLSHWYTTLPGSRLRERFTFDSSHTLAAWNPGELAIQKQGSAARIAIPWPDSPSAGRFILHARIQGAGEAQAAFSYSAAGQKAYNENPGQVRSLLPGTNDLYFYMETGASRPDLRLEISPAGALDSLDRMEIREFYGGKP